MIESESRQNIRFRTACDPCSTAKVRCDKKHPACDRCVQTKLKCSYSESRKHGRQSWRQRLASERSKMATIAAAEGRPLAPTKPPTTTTTSADEPGWESLLAGPAPLIAGDQTWESLLNPEQNQFDTDLLSSWPSDSALHTGIDIGGLDNWDSGAIPIQEPAGESPSVSTNDTSESSTHNCEAQAISILNSMQHGEMYQGFTSCPTDPTQAYAQLVLSPTFDRVIAVNKAALEGWNKLVRCSCAQCPHLLLLYTSILSKMVFWYRIAATEKLASSDCTDSSGSPPSSGRTRFLPEEAPTVDRFSVRPTAIQVGMLSLDAEDQADLRRALLLRELRRTVQAIDDLLNLDRRTIEEGADEFIRSSVQWTLTGISRLKEELQGVMQQVKQMQ